MDLQQIEKNDLWLSEPLPWPLFDKEGKLLFMRGQTIGAELWPQDGQVFRNVAEEEATPPAPAIPRPPEEAARPVFDDSFPPHGIKPQVGERVRIRRLQQDTTSHYEVKLIGYIKGRTILVSQPQIRGRMIELAEGERLEVAMLVGRNIYQFETQVERVAIAPTHYLHLRQPEGVRRQELRQSPWVRVSLAATIKNGEGESFPAFLSNLSASGAKFSAPEDLGNENDSISISLPLSIDEMKTELALEGEIRHVRTTRDEDGLREFGVSFKNLRLEDAVWLKCLVYQRIAGGFLI